MTLNVGLSFETEFGNGSTLKPWIYVYLSDDYKTTNDPIFWAVQESFTTIDFGFTWQSPSETWLAGLFVDNATDEAIMTDGTMFSRGRGNGGLCGAAKLGHSPVPTISRRCWP